MPGNSMSRTDGRWVTFTAMICTIHNASASARIFYDVQKREVRVDPGCVRYADIDEGTYVSLRARSDLIVKGASFAKHAPPEPPPAALPITQKSPIVITGHFGIGDNLHQRAVIRELMPTHDVWLHTCHFNLYHDLIAQGLKLVMRSTGLHAQAKTIAREQQQFAYQTRMAFRDSRGDQQMECRWQAIDGASADCRSRGVGW